MNTKNLTNLRLLALLFLLPGLAGLIISSMISVTYLENLPKLPEPSAMRMTPRMIHGVTIYETQVEDRRLQITEDTSIAVFLIGLGLGLLYLRKWGIARAIGGQEEDLGFEEH